MTKKVLSFSVSVALGWPLCVNAEVLRWASNPESGPPYAFFSWKQSQRRINGVDADVIREVAKRIGYEEQFCINDWDNLIPGLCRGLYDVVINGIIAPEKPIPGVIFTQPYFRGTRQLVVRQDEKQIIDLTTAQGHRLGVIQDARTQNLLGAYPGIKVLYYPDEYEVLFDLSRGQIDAVLMDSPGVLYHGSTQSGIRVIADSVVEIEYVMALRAEDKELWLKINRALDGMKSDGSLLAIMRYWGLCQRPFCRMMGIPESSESDLSSAPGYQHFLESTQTSTSWKDFVSRYQKFIPFLCKAALITLQISVVSMGIAVLLGLVLALLRLYAPKWIRCIAILWIEFLRGTPLLIQLFFIFYGLPLIGISFSPFCAAVLALGLNYSAFEAENYRAGLLSVPRAQMEAARALGMTQWQALRHVIVPQAFSFVLPPMTNDFIALLKDSSLASLVTIVELTKTYTLLANSYFDFFGTGVMVALFYLIIGLPFAYVAHCAERYMSLEKQAYKGIRARRKKHDAVSTVF
ncbi:MAG: ABC transporter substrate-binding protein/permease [Puniceicoccales bacterium]|jgi:polar amino acid transport system substrate-binding protein|nr:ABC transporter substrate-binding protein/permease [Puniceicoccales bacterium]